MQNILNSQLMFETVFFDVGQGDCSVAIDHAGRVAAIIDCADSSSAKDRLIELQKNGIRLSLLCITHYHEDHYKGFLSLLNSIDISSLMYFLMAPSFIRQSRVGKRQRVLVRGIRQLIDQRSTAKPSFVINSTTQVVLKNIRLDFLYPDANDLLDAVFGEFTTSSICNDTGLLIRLSYEIQGTLYRVLIGSDNQAESWHRVLSKGCDITANVFRFPHHGSDFFDNRVSLNAVLDAVRPEHVIISVGSNNSYGHPSRNTIKAIANCKYVKRLLCTQATCLCSDTQNGESLPCAGNISVRFSPSGITVIPNLQKHIDIRKSFKSPLCQLFVSNA